ncbi:MAG: type II secretion system protein [Phycisphaerales bacterium]
MRPSVQHSARRTRPAIPRGFTLTELLVAIGVLVVVIVATARIFGTVTKVTGAGEANVNLLQTAQAIENQIRDDIGRLSRDGFMVIESIDVPNNVNGAGAPLLNPALVGSARLRSDRIAFFVEGTMSSTQFAGSQQISSAFDSTTQETKYTLPLNQASAARIYYGHGVQVPATFRDATLAGTDDYPELANGQPLFPWTFDFNNDGPDLTMQKWDTGSVVKDVSATQPTAPNWLLLRQAIILADDGANGFTFYNQNTTANNKKNATRFLWFSKPTGSNATYDPGPRSSRVDISAHTLDKLRVDCTNAGTNSIAATRSQMLRLLNDPTTAISMRYPRAERVAPSMNRADEMLTNPVLAAGCSSFAIEWTWVDGTGRANDSNTGRPIDPTPAQPSSGDEWIGFYLSNNSEQPWFGMPNAERGVLPLSSAPVYNGQAPTGWGCYGLPIYPQLIEATPVVQTYAGLPGLQVYRAVFGYNQSRPYDLDPTTGAATVSPNLGFTPWPTALRFTFTLNDPQGRFPEGRTFQFVVELPRR